MPHNTPGERFDRADGNQPYRPATAARDPRDIVIKPGWNVRDMASPETVEHVKALKASILQRIADGLPGVKEAIDVTYDRNTGVRTLVDGQCRLTACNELWKEGHKVFVPLLIVEGESEAELLVQSLTANSGLSLTKWEVGVGCRRLIVGCRWTSKQVAAHIGKTVAYVNEAVTLAEAPTEVKKMIADRQITEPFAVSELKAAKKAGVSAAKAVETLKEAVHSRPAETEPQTNLDGVSPHRDIPKPVARPKKPSARETAIKTVPANAVALLELADKACALFLDDDAAFPEVRKAALAYQKARAK